MITREVVQQDYNYCTERISEQSRTISLAILAIDWLFLAAKEKPILDSMPSEGALLIIGALCLTALIADYFQYLFGYFNSKKLLDAADAEKKNELDYDYDACLYKARSFMFLLKHVSTLCAAGVLVTTVSFCLLGI